MNKNRPTKRRITWTTKALNFFLPIYYDIDDLVISKEDSEEGYAAGVIVDAAKITSYITLKLGVIPQRINTNLAYRGTFLYERTPHGMYVSTTPVSDLFEVAYDAVGDLYVKHQKTLDEAEEVEGFSSDEEGEEESESDSSESNSEDDILEDIGFSY